MEKCRTLGIREKLEKTPKNPDIGQHNCPPGDTETRNHESARDRVVQPLVLVCRDSLDYDILHIANQEFSRLLEFSYENWFGN